MKPLVSIIIPVYNVEKYLDKCVASVVNQTYTNLEIILIDDGSPDNCPAICDAWKARDPRINVIHQQNGGLSVARNEGLKLATGEFIGFVDSDDWIEPQMVELLLTALLETEADIAVCRYQVDLGTSKEVHEKIESTERNVYSSEDALRKLLAVEGSICNYVWNKLYRKSVISKIFFPEGKMYEDIPWTAMAIGNSSTVVSIDCSLYHYFVSPESLSRNDQQKVRRLYDELEMIEARIVYIQDYYPNLKRFSVLRLHNFCCREYLTVGLKFSHLDPDGKIRNELHQHFCQYRPHIFLNKQDIVKSIARILFWLSPKAVAFIWKRSFG